MLDLPIEQRTFGGALIEQAARYGAKPFLRFEDQVISYNESLAISRRLAAAIRDMGIERGQHVALLMNNHPNMLWTMFALALLGVVTVPVNSAAKGTLLAYFLRHSRSIALFIDRDLLGHYQAVAKDVPSIRSVIVHDEAGAPEPMRQEKGMAWHTLQTLLRWTGPEFAGNDANFKDVQLIMYTSGTTGPSKGVMCSHSQEQTGGLFMAQQMGYVDSDILYTCLPIFHANAIRVTVTAALWAGAGVAMSRRFSASNFWHEISMHKATQFNSLGAMANILMQAPPATSDRDHNVRICNIVPALPGAKLQEFEQRFGIRVTSLYGSTEMCCPIFATTATPLDKWPTCGRIAEPFELRVVDDNDFELPPGQTGEWILRSREPWYVFQGYLDMPAETMAAWQNGWFHTGDRGYVDAEGNFYFVDRKKESLRRRGENISSYEVELAICSHPSVLETAVVAVPSELGEDDVMAYVVLRPNASLTEVELANFCEANMARFMVPRFIRFIAELPKTPSEKVEKYKLKQMAEQQRAELWDREKVMGRFGSKKPQPAQG